MWFKPASISGARRRVGVELGRLGRARFGSLLDQSPLWAALRPWRGHAYLDELAGHAQRALPAVWEEFEGMAEGLRVPFPDLLLWQSRGDLLHPAADGCTSIAWRGRDGACWMGHNEDGDPYLYRRCALVDVRPDDAPGYVAFAYPGSLPGHAFGANRAGLAQTINNVRMKTRRPGVPRIFLARAVLDCATLDEALALLNAHPRAGGFHHLLGSAADGRLVSVECVPGACSMAPIERGAGHANHLLHPGTSTIPQVITDSSRARQQRVENLMDQWDADSGPDNVVGALLDNAGDLPILRMDKHDPDAENTMATALFELRDGGVTLRVYDRAPKPLAEIRIV
ncbi:acyl-coenzyme A:6-aminopenicillanic-acid-acyltransferase [Bordetella ansorpii]|uniref:Acyl-coenzyme A:6-aminopenicillanic-acid-acyltransferase n=1 Tax=Bordetella ansorpii TaxID=288768 RepID=A0A157SXH8_9BORD|nr:C45 family peptidase [Bordetella ansorpii]SAI74753.1 acyl-coenzyme A:6-aminopenicillanic-acid-acyltransferase [Bordetella ansorpii]